MGRRRERREGPQHRGDGGGGGGDAGMVIGEVLVRLTSSAADGLAAFELNNCPASVEEQEAAAVDANGAGGGAAATLRLPRWLLLNGLLSWFARGVEADPTAALLFPAALDKRARAHVHGVVEATLSHALASVSRGVGAARCVAAVSRAAAPPAPAADAAAVRLFHAARAAGLGVSRDEIAERLAAGALTPELRALSEALAAAEPGAVARLCAAAAAGDAPAAAAALAALPSDAARAACVTAAGAAGGRTALHVAAAGGHRGVVELLAAAAGSALNVRDARGRTALALAQQLEHCDAEAALLQAGARDGSGSGGETDGGAGADPLDGLSLAGAAL
jgi:hypothetical protein